MNRSPHTRFLFVLVVGMGSLFFPTAGALAIPAELPLAAHLPALQSDGSQDPAALALLERASRRYQGLQGFCADFQQVVQNDLLRRTIRSHGELCQMGSDRFEMRFADPEGDRVVADGRHLWIYFPSTDPYQAFQTDPGAAQGRFDLHAEFLQEPGRRYAPNLQGREVIDGRETRILALTPLVPSPYLRARIWVDDGEALIRRIEITETEGFVRTVTLRSLRLNPSLPASRFTFEAPPGVRVVRR